MIAQEYVKSFLHYNPDTGIVTRTIRRSSKALAGKEVGISTSHGYKTISIDKRIYRLHSIIWLYVYGFIPKYIDHKNGIRTDNRLSNLRECTNQQNGFNSKVDRNTVSGYVGITFHKPNQKWRVRVYINKKVNELGCYKNIADAINARNEFCKKHHGDFYRPINH